MKLLPICLCALLACWLTACQSSLISDLAAQPGEKLFWDEFSDASGNWPQGSDANGSVGIANGEYRIQVFSPHYQVIAAPGHIFRDVQVEAEATWLAGPVQNSFGLACRSSNANSYYFFVISNDGYYALGKIKNGLTTLLGQEMMAYSTAITQGEGSYHLRLDCIGKSLKGIVNGQLIAMSEDADFSSGKVGLVAGALDAPGVDVAFDHFIVYQP
jgi:hypothetical protein